nr:5'-nucleotidase [Roseibium sp. RKSG952]
MPDVQDSKSTPLRIAVSARSLFDLETSHAVFETEGLESYTKFIRKNERKPLSPGPAFPLVKALLRANRTIRGEESLIEVIMASGVHPIMGNWIVNSIEHHDLDIPRSSFTSGGFILPYLQAFGVDMLLSKSMEDAQKAINVGMAAAVMYDTEMSDELLADEGAIRIALDGDSVIFSDESERIYQEGGLEAFQRNETMNAHVPMNEGPFAPILRKIARIQKVTAPDHRPFRIALVTARGGPSRTRVFNTLDAWGIEVDEAHFLSGFKKRQILAAFSPHLFLDDQHTHVGPAAELMPAGRVPYRTESAA